MSTIKQVIALCFSAGMLTSCTTNIVSSEHQSTSTHLDANTVVAQSNVTDLTIATWNMEHLAFPSDSGCKPRTSTEIEELKTYASSLNADVIALQEVASLQAVEQVFPPADWHIIMSSRPDNEPYICRKSGHTSTQQKVAFVVKKPLKINNTSALTELALGSPGLRYGLSIELDSDFGPLSLLNVHLKSGCFVDNLLESDKQACATLSRQVPIIDKWIEKQDKQGAPFIILGDFNHRLSAPYNQVTQDLMTNQRGEQRSIVNTAANLIGCHPYYPAPIDHLFIGNLNSTTIDYQTKIQHFDDMQVDAMLSDHCALTTTLKRKTYALSNAVKWQTKSKEYKFMTRGIYQQAEARLANMPLPDKSWVVVMDVDETVLDNSAYQVMLDQSGATYTSQSWDNWVASKRATLVPGASEFMQKVFAMGGKVALITNRNKQLDAATWQNLSQLIPVTSSNTCLTGRTTADKEAINGDDIINDKDLRRQQLTHGNIDCFTTANKPALWGLPQAIVMQIGDNIEDIDGVTQEHADIGALLERWNKDVFILPNPMYGSW